MGPDLVTTEIDVAGANCPWCLNEMLDALRRQPGVVAADTSMGDGCLRLEHWQLPVDGLVDVVRTHLHADDMSSGEHLMVKVDPVAAERHCGHREAHG